MTEEVRILTLKLAVARRKNKIDRINIEIADYEQEIARLEV